MDSRKAENIDPRQHHHKDLWWKILLPVLLISLLALVFLVFLVLNHTKSLGTTSTWSHIAIIWLILPALLAGILIILLLLTLIRGLQKFYKWLPPRFHKAGVIFKSLEANSLRLSNKTASPLIGIQSQLSGFITLFHMIKTKK